jgi:hypothetical protein
LLTPAASWSVKRTVVVPQEARPSFDSNAAPPSINKVKDQFRVLEANIRQAQLVSTSDCFLTIPCDHWTSVAKQSYCGMTAHLIDEDFKFRSCTMDLRDAFLINLFKDCNFDLRKVNIVAYMSEILQET